MALEEVSDDGQTGVALLLGEFDPLRWLVTWF